MPRKYKIRWLRSDTKKVKQAIKTFNTKITRTLKQHPEWKEFIPNKISYEEFRSGINTRQDFNRELNRIKRFGKKGAEMPVMSEGGARATKWEVREERIKTQVINRRRAKERKEANVSTAKGTMGSIRANNLLPKRFNFKRMSQREWEKYKESTNKQVKATYTLNRAIQYKEDYLRNVEEKLRGSANFQILFDYVSKLDPNMMVNVFYDDPVLQINFTSDPLPIDMITDEAIRHWYTVNNDPLPEMVDTLEDMEYYG